MIQEEYNKKKTYEEKDFFKFLHYNLIEKLNSGYVFIKDNSNDVSKVQNTTQEIDYNTNIILIKVNTFNKDYLEEDNKIFYDASCVRDTQNIDNIIIDLRGNSGGTDEYFKLFSFMTPVSISKKSRWRDQISGKIETIKYNALESNMSGKDYNRFLLVDENVFSASESFVKLFKQNNLGCIIGTRTLGEGFGMTPFELKLSDRYSLAYPVEAPINERDEIDYNEYNTVPDLVVNSNYALESAFKIIENNKKLY